LKFFNRQRLKLTISVQLLLQFSLFNKYFVIISLTNILFNYFAYLCYITDDMNLVLYAGLLLVGLHFGPVTST